MTDPDEHEEIPDEEFEEGDIDELGDEIGDDLDEEFNDVLEDGDLDEDLDEEIEEEEEDGNNGPVRNAAMSEDEDSDGEDIDPDNVEADLDTILKDRLAAGDDEDEDEETPDPSPEVSGQVAPKRDNEWTCEGCFLIVSSSQFGPRDNPRCPSGEEPCPSLVRL
ncbi:hypothetical protein [Candidatus Poriferisocius sp.]|uniref:hypothetical protein n=1 Tax=Candidatus Poriferisocius sp. TaxID=3101276 RepID=UPI003B01F00A